MGILHFLLNFYEIQTQTIVKNGVFAELDETTKHEVQTITQRNNITVAKQMIVTNFRLPTIIAGRLKNNVEIYISKHFIENEDAKKNFKPWLELSLTIISTHQTLKNLCIRSILYATNLLAMLILRPIITTQLPYGFAILISICGIIDIATMYLNAWINCNDFYMVDAAASKTSGIEPLKEALLFMDSQTKYDKDTAMLPPWKLTFPRNIDRIAHLNALENKS